MVKLADIGFEFPDNSKQECSHDEDEDVCSAEDATKGDLMKQLEALSYHTTVVSKEEKKGVCYLYGKKGHWMADCDLLKLLIKILRGALA